MMMIKEPLLPQQPPFPSSLLIYLYVGHFLARWGARMWEFSVGLYMINVWPDSLLLAALYGVVESASTVLLGPLIGQWVDKLPYVKVLQIWLFTQNLSFIVAGGSVIAMLIYSDLKLTNFMAFVSLVIVTNICGAVGMLSTVAGTILIEREWVVVISEGHPPEFLTKMNSVIRRIDLICKLCAPVVSGFIISFISLKASALALSIWNTLSVCLQYWLLMSVYNGIPSLSERNQKRVSRLSPMPEESPSTSQERRSLLSYTENDSELSQNNGKWTISKWFSKSPYISAWRVYLQQDVVLPGVALALLYFTVLSFGSLMTATLEWEGIPAYVIGIARGVSATIGIGATFLYPIVQSRISTLRTGIWSIWSQWTCLLLCVASIWVQNNLVSAYMLMGGVAASRLGLWMFDLSVIQQMQDQVPESDRIVVGGVQNSIQSVLDLMTYVMGVIISNPQQPSCLLGSSCLPMGGSLQPIKQLGLASWRGSLRFIRRSRVQALPRKTTPPPMLRLPMYLPKKKKKERKKERKKFVGLRLGFLEGLELSRTLWERREETSELVLHFHGFLGVDYDILSVGDPGRSTLQSAHLPCAETPHSP